MLASPLHLNLFVYGTLRKGSDSEMGRWLMQHAQWCGTGRVRGVLYEIESYPGFVPDPCGSWIQGDVFRLGPEKRESVLAALDDYEQCSPRFPQPWEYRREMLDINGPDGCLPAWTYVYAWPVEGKLPITSGDFLFRQP
ncbi:MAG: gamma-glutamylcyclotransferase [Sphingobium sp.]|uniref:gamma-glutamylcyclotransferase family protein n=1 Tax=Sphingobium sp. TaxID=1912891 RepID=UPI0029A4AC55|nr:gamma-glutamylcyclotransferase family protein [Sphingobium sp.]MDX3910764.1 gamma-glutamylcyclotransferase [Sphingobium sp.]